MSFLRSLQSKSKASTRPEIETLEDRTVPAQLGLTPSGGLAYAAAPGEANRLTVSATAGTYTFRDQGAVIRLSRALRAPGATQVDAHTVIIPATAFNGLGVNLGNGNDVFTLLSTSRPTTVNTGAGNDRIHIGGGSLDGTQAPVVVNGGGGRDTLAVNDQRSVTPGGIRQRYLVTNSEVKRERTAGLTYSGLEGLTINGSSGRNSFKVLSTAATTPVTINGSAGDDGVQFGDRTHSLGGIRGSVTINGRGSPADNEIYFDDSASAAGHTYSLTNHSLVRDGAARITFHGFADLTLDATDFDDTLHLWSAPAESYLDLDKGFNRVYGPDAPSVWEISDYGGGQARVKLNDRISIRDVSALVGGRASDRFVVTPSGRDDQGNTIAFNGGGGPVSVEMVPEIVV